YLSCLNVTILSIYTGTGKKEIMFEITPYIDEKVNEAKYVQIYRYIKTEIMKGNIPSGTRLPSIRKLAAYLHVGRNTIELAYQQLLAEGYVENRSRVGVFVTEFEKDVSMSGSPLFSIRQESINVTQRHTEYLYDFRHGNIDQKSFPLSLWRTLSNEIFRTKQTEVLQYGEQQGELELRREIAHYLYQSRGVSCSAEQIIIGAGIQQLLILLSQLIGIDGQAIAMENPGYDGARAIFNNHRFQVQPIPLEQDGIHLQKLKQSKARIVYVTPSHQFPCGMVMSISKRMQILQWAEEHDGMIIEDDYDGEFKYYTKPIPALQGLDSNGRVVYLGTFSKSLLPSIRLSYMVLPPRLLERYQSDFAIYEQPVSKIHQMTLELFMRNGYWERHLRKVRKIYQKKHAILLSTIENIMGDRVRIIGKNSGLHILVEIQRSITEEQLIEAAKHIGVKVYPTSKYWIHPDKSRKSIILLGFGGLTEEEIVKGITLLNQAWFLQ
ncbi:PLP-dependent aminotransferase family protein, partial [Aneurinibacillus migulanus]